MPKDFSLGEAMYDTAGKEVAPGGFLYQPHTANYLGGMSVPGGGGLLGRSPPVTYTPPAVTYTPPAGVIPDPRMLAGRPGAPGTRMGMTPGMHSSHLGAYETADGTWVWGDMPSAEGEATLDASRGPLTGLLEGYGVPTMAGAWPGDVSEGTGSYGSEGDVEGMGFYE